MAPASNGWKFEQSLSVGFILAVIIQGGLIIWWSATIENRVATLEAKYSELTQRFAEKERSNLNGFDRLTRLEEQMKSQTILMERIYRIIDNGK